MPDTIVPNVTSITRKLIVDAEAPDLHHAYMVESRLFDCRALGVYANISRMSPKLQDEYLDCRAALESKVPINASYYQDVLAGRLHNLRSDYVLDVLMRACAVKGVADPIRTSITATWHLAPDSLKYRFCQDLVGILQESIVTPILTNEEFSDEGVMTHALQIIDTFNEVIN